jgi:hypothetical protein
LLGTLGKCKKPSQKTSSILSFCVADSSEVVNGVPSTKWLKLAEAILNFPKPLSDYATFAFYKTTNKIMVTCIYNLFHFLIWNIFILPQKEKYA